MSGQRVWLWGISLAAVVAAILYRGSVDRKPAAVSTPKIAFVTGGTGPFWQATVAGAKAAARDHQVELQTEMPEGDENLEQQVTILTHLDLKHLDGVALSPLDAEGQTHMINQMAHEKNVVTFDSDAPLSDRQSYIGTSNVAAGATCGRVVKEALPEGGKIAVLLSNLTKENLRDRQSGFQEALGLGAEAEASADAKRTGPQYVVVDYLLDNGDDEQCAANIRQEVGKHADLACFVGMNAHHGPVLLKVLKDLDKLGKIKLVTFDDDRETLDGLTAGYIYATIAQDPYKYGYEAVNVLASLCRGSGDQLPVVGKGSVYVGAEPIRQATVDEFRARIKKRQESVQTRSAEQ
jgi:ribose transport system substrate-binding protein